MAGSEPVGGPANRAADEQPAAPGAVIVDCQTCTVRGIACDDCVIAVLLGGPPDEETEPLGMDPVEVRALGALAEGGLLPPLRLTRWED